MSERHFWPTEPGRHLMEAKSGERIFLRLLANGDWKNDYSTNAFDEREIKNHYLGVRKPFDKADERPAFDLWHQGRYGWAWDGDIAPDMGEDERARARWQAWLAAKRHERGIA